MSSSLGRREPTSSLRPRSCLSIHPVSTPRSRSVDLSKRWEGASRPGHLRAVATVVTILLNLAQPARSYFGEKDYQQLQVIRRMHHDLALPGEIIGCPTVRDADGLALSSRNVRLSEEERAHALSLPRAIAAVTAAAARGESDARQLEAIARSELDGTGVEVDYLALVDDSSLEPLQHPASRRPAAHCCSHRRNQADRQRRGRASGTGRESFQRRAESVTETRLCH